MNHDALVYYDKSLKMGFNEFWIKYNCGSMLIDMGNYPLGMKDLEKANMLDPTHEGVKIRLQEVRDKLLSNSK